jgi:myo-inositol-1(or 4)-monophosphatase
MTVVTDPVLAVAVRAARRAAAVVADAARDLKRLPSYSNEHGGIVAAAKTEAAQAIVATLSGAFPDHRVTEADATDGQEPAGESAYRWIVDPLDGTINFVHGYPYYAVSLALAHGAELTHAVVLDPVRDELFTAVHGKGAELNGAPLRTSSCTRIEDALIGTAVPSRRSTRLPAYLAAFNAIVTRCASVRRGGACALDLAYLAAGRLDGFWVMSRRPSDLAAGALLVIEGGGRVGDFAGTPDFLRSPDVIAAAPGVFNPLREAIVAAAR